MYVISVIYIMDLMAKMLSTKNYIREFSFLKTIVINFIKNN